MIELISVIVILGILGTGASRLFASSIDTYIETVNDNKLSMETWIALERISRELRHATTVFAPGAGDIGSTLHFRRNICPECVDSSGDITFAYTPADRKLWRTSQGTGARELADNVSSFTVATGLGANGKKVIKISITRVVQSQSGNVRFVTMETAVHPQGIRNQTYKEIVR